MNDNGLRNKAAGGFLWVAVYTAGARGAQFAASLILAGILFPRDFGAFALGAVLVNGLIMFREMGFTPALIQIREEPERAFSAALTAVPVFGLLVYCLIYAVAPLFASSLGDETLTPIVRILGLAAPLTSLGVIPAVYLQRNMRFKQKAVPEFASVALASTAAIIMALKGMGVMSLVLGLVMTEALKSALYWIVVGRKFRPALDLPMVKRLLKYGVQVSFGSAMCFCYTLIDQYTVGRWFGTVSAGFYSFAFKPCMQVSNNVVILSNQVALPTLSSLQHNPAQFYQTYLKILSLFTLIATPLSAFIFIFAQDLLHALYGAKWDGAITALRIFAFYGWVRGVGALNTEVYFAKARPRYFTFQMGGQLILAMVTLPLAVKYGTMETVAFIFTAVLVLSNIIAFLLAAKLMEAPLLPTAAVFLPHLFSLGAGALSLAAAGSIGCPLSLRIFAFFIGYALPLLLFYRKQLLAVREYFSGIIRSKAAFDKCEIDKFNDF